MMRFSKFLAIITLMLVATNVAASVKEEADSLYGIYYSAQQSNTNTEYAYSVLSDCCSKYIELLDTKSVSVDDYAVAKERLRALYPHLQQGGVYFSRHKNVPMAVRLLEQYINLPQHRVFKEELFKRSEYYPSLVYYVASNKFNTQDFKNAVVYLNEYLATGEHTNERHALLYLSRAYGYNHNDESQILTLMRAVKKFPNDADILHDIVKFYIRAHNAPQAELFMARYEKLKVNPMELYHLKAGISELKGDYFASLQISESLYNKNPNNYDYARMYARCSYNYVIMEMKKGKVTSNGKPNSELRPYLERAVNLFIAVVNKQPDKVYVDGLIDIFILLDRQEEALALSRKMGREIENVNNNSAVISETATQLDDGKKVSKNGIPMFSTFAKDFVTEHFTSWMQKGDFEKRVDYEERTSKENIETKKNSLLQDARAAYINQYSGLLRVNGIVIEGYDADHEVYLIKYNLGNMLVHVPLEGEQAQKFQDDWNHGCVSVAEPKFDISGDSLVLSELSFVSPSGMSYKYDISEALKYEKVDVKLVNPGILLSDNLLANIDDKEKKSRQNIDNTTIEVGNVNKKSDIDVDIPQDTLINTNTFALILCNENYAFADHVNYALSDGKSFESYCRKTLGVPKKNIIRVDDGSYLGMKMKIAVFTDLVREYADSARVIVYYSGHGVPNYETQEAFLLPTDGSPVNMSGTLSLEEFYTQLSSTNVRSINVFLDCCFSGASKTGSMLMAARGTVIKPKANSPKGNMVVMSACSGDEVAFPYGDQRHGMFTYFLLKKLKESNGTASLGDIYDYVVKNVRRQSLLDKKKKQVPNVMVAAHLEEVWSSMKLK